MESNMINIKKTTKFLRTFVGLFSLILAILTLSSTDASGSDDGIFNTVLEFVPAELYDGLPRQGQGTPGGPPTADVVANIWCYHHCDEFPGTSPSFINGKYKCAGGANQKCRLRKQTVDLNRDPLKASEAPRQRHGQLSGNIKEEDKNTFRKLLAYL
jgi:hypothetical protein